MTSSNKKHHKSAAYGDTRNKSTKCGNEFQAVIYDDFMGVPYVVTFLGNRWWMTTSNEKLQPLEEFFDRDDIGFCHLCEAGGTVGALALAKMLGVALENPEDKVDEVLLQRVESLKRLGVMLDVKDEPLVLQLEIIPNKNFILRQGKFSAICHLHGNFFEKFFDIDAFDCKENAEEWVGYYFDVLEKLGIKFKII
jgi:hypothetical protein